MCTPSHLSLCGSPCFLFLFLSIKRAIISIFTAPPQTTSCFKFKTFNHILDLKRNYIVWRLKYGAEHKNVQCLAKLFFLYFLHCNHRLKSFNIFYDKPTQTSTYVKWKEKDKKDLHPAGHLRKWCSFDPLQSRHNVGPNKWTSIHSTVWML